MEPIVQITIIKNKQGYKIVQMSWRQVEKVTIIETPWHTIEYIQPILEGLKLLEDTPLGSEACDE